jgi:hypothetical protein
LTPTSTAQAEEPDYSACRPAKPGSAGAPKWIGLEDALVGPLGLYKRTSPRAVMPCART